MNLIGLRWGRVEEKIRVKKEMVTDMNSWECCNKFVFSSKKHMGSSMTTWIKIFNVLKLNTWCICFRRNNIFNALHLKQRVKSFYHNRRNTRKKWHCWRNLLPAFPKTQHGSLEAEKLKDVEGKGTYFTWVVRYWRNRDHPITEEFTFMTSIDLPFVYPGFTE